MHMDSLRESELLARSTTDLYKWQSTRTGLPEFTLHDGPPYANGSLHMGHFLNKVLKDIVNRHKLMTGHRVNFIPGWDCHGLPIEHKALSIFKKNNEGKVPLSSVEIRTLAEKLAIAAIAEQKESFYRWGIMADWDSVDGTYRTMDPSYESGQLEVFLAMVEKGFIYRGLKPVSWSPSSRTALAEAEVEYEDAHISPSVYVGFPITRAPAGSPDLLSRYPRLEAVIWTTTPWTLPANRAICFNDALQYAVVRSTTSAGRTKLLMLAADRVSAAAQDGEHTFETLEVLPGSALHGMEYRHPLETKLRLEPGVSALSSGAYASGHGQGSHPFLASEHVTKDSGSGFVHTAPAHGVDDWRVCADYATSAGAAGGRQLHVATEEECLVDEGGRFTAQAGAALRGLFVLKEGNAAVMTLLDQAGALLATKPYTHKYPYDWRSKQPLIVRATRQWFCGLDTLTHSCADALTKVHMVPDQGRARLNSFLASRKEWCISRQRSWGLPIPVFYSKDDPTVHLLTPESVRHVIEVVRKHGSNAWWELPTEELLPAELRPDAQNWVRGMDTMDVWFDSGSSWHAVLGKRRGASTAVADVYLEGSDQHRGWFQSSLLTSVAVSGRAPYRNIITHGFVLDDKGRKMSKSLGNVLLPSDLLQSPGAAQPAPAAQGVGKGKAKPGREESVGVDVVRWWVASAKFVDDVVIGKKQVLNMRESVRKIRNTLRFCLGNVHDMEVGGGSGQLRQLDRHMLHEVRLLQLAVDQGYACFHFSKVVEALVSACNGVLSAFYFDLAKERLYLGKPDCEDRRAVQRVLLHCLHVLLKAIAPIVPFHAEEIYEHIPPRLRPLLCAPAASAAATSPSPSVFALGWMPNSEAWENVEVWQRVERARALRTKVARLIEKAKVPLKANTPGHVDLRLVFAAGRASQSALFTGLTHLHASAPVSELDSFFGTATVALDTAAVHPPSELSSTRVVEVVRVPAVVPGDDEVDVAVEVRPAKLCKCPRCWRHVREEAEHVCRRCATALAARLLPRPPVTY